MTESGASDASISNTRLFPPSEYWSPAFRAVYEAMEAGREDFALKVPRRDASIEAWEHYDAALDEKLQPYIARARLQYAVSIDYEIIHGVPVAHVRPRNSSQPTAHNCLLINLHAGGFFANRGFSFGLLESIPISALGGLHVITLDYRQAPRYSYPTASEDVRKVYRVLHEANPALRIGIFGSSAGGALAAQTVPFLQEAGLPVPRAVGIFAAGMPTPDWPLAKRGDSSIWRLGLLPTFDEHSIAAESEPNEWYLSTAKADDRCAFPGSFTDVLAKFPPTFFLTGTRDYWFSAALVAHNSMLDLGVDTTFYAIEGGWHAAHAMAIGTVEAHMANSAAACWFRTKLLNARMDPY